MNRPELTVRMPLARQELSSRPSSDQGTPDLFERSLRRAKADQESPTEVKELREDQALVEQRDVTEVGVKPTLSGRSGADSVGGQQPGGFENKPELPLVEYSSRQRTPVLRQDVALGMGEDETPFSFLPGNAVNGGTGTAVPGSGRREGGGDTSAATSYQNFSRVLSQHVRETSLDGTREWRFSLQDSRLPLAQINMTSLPSGGWSVALASTGIDRETLARRLDELEVKLANLNRNVEGVEVVKERSQ